MIRKKNLLFSYFLFLFLSTLGVNASGKEDTQEDIKAQLDKPAVRGSIVFKNYCVLCHGESANGDARAAKLHGQESLAIKPGSSRYYKKIIRQGGEAVGKSVYMPTYQKELSNEQIKDVVTYLQVINKPVKRGEMVYMANCILCHGVKANGKGRASVLFDPPPANLRRSDKNDDYKRMIITLGGEAMGRSSVMPEWGQQLTEQQIDDVIVYLRKILVI